jgi:gamma-glutamyltranspeptidase/glutathione hydrolase
LARGAAVESGDWLVQPELAHTLELIAEFGPDAFYRCDHQAGIAQAIVHTQLVTRLVNPDGIGLMTCEDLESYAVEVLAPISRPYRGYEVFSMPPPSSGGIAVLQILSMLEGYPIGDEGAGFGFGESAALNVMLEAMRLAFADRALWVGDDDCSDCFDVPIAGLLSEAYLADRAGMIQVGQRLTGIKAGYPPPSDVMFENEGLFGDSAESSGFLLNNQLTDFNRVPTYNPDPMAFDPGANDAAPGKQPRSSMAPTMVFLEGDPVAAYGSPGGATIINTVVNMTLNLIDHRLTLQESVAAPRISITSASDSAIGERESGFSLVTMNALQALGYQFNVVPAIGAAQAVIRIPTSGKLYGAADERRIGGVVAADEF